MKFLLDMNLPPSWCSQLGAKGHDAVHWSSLGDHRATDRQLMEAALADGRVVMTQDLDFGALLASSRSSGPSVVLLRAADISAPEVFSLLLAALDACAAELTIGAIVTVELTGHRVRSLPLRPDP